MLLPVTLLPSSISRLSCRRHALVVQTLSWWMLLWAGHFFALRGALCFVYVYRILTERLRFIDKLLQLCEIYLEQVEELFLVLAGMFIKNSSVRNVEA